MNTVGILGGMGPAAGADFVRLFVQACAEHLQNSGQSVRDQSFPEHWLAQVPVPDRTEALANLEQGEHQPLEPMLQALGRLAALGARSVAIACNTAHAWHTRLQERFPHMEVLHMAQEVVSTLAKQGVQSVSLMATEGTYRTALYEQAFAQRGIACYLPQPEQRQRIMQGIFEGVKASNMPLASKCFQETAWAMHQAHPFSPIIMGCTEIPLGLASVPTRQDLHLIDPARVLAASLAQRAYAVSTT